MTPPLDREALASEFRRIEGTGEHHLTAFLPEPPTVELAMFVGDLIGAPESGWRAVMSEAPLGCSVYIYDRFSPVMQTVLEKRKELYGY